MPLEADRILVGADMGRFYTEQRKKVRQATIARAKVIAQIAIGLAQDTEQDPYLTNRMTQTEGSTFADLLSEAEKAFIPAAQELFNQAKEAP